MRRTTPKDVKEIYDKFRTPNVNQADLLAYALAGQRLEDKIENGEFIEPPCKIGDTLYWVRNEKSINEVKVISITAEIDISGVYIYINCENLDNDNLRCELSAEDIGDCVFFTRKEAEATLKELRYNEWKRQNGYKAENVTVEETLRLIFNAMDEEDQKIKE